MATTTKLETQQILIDGEWRDAEGGAPHGELAVQRARADKRTAAACHPQRQ